MTDAAHTGDESFRTLFLHSPDAIFIETREGVILDANPAAARLQGVPAEKLIGRNVLDLVPAAERERVRRDFEGWFNGTVTRYDGYARRDSGEAVAVEITGTPLLFRGEPAVVLHVRDVSERRAAEQALIEREWLVGYALDQGDAVLFRRSFVTDTYDYIAPGIERLSGYRADEITPSRWDRLVDHCEFAGELADLAQGEPRRRFLAGKVSRWQAQVLIRRKQGDLRWVLDMSTVVRDAEGRPVGALGVLQDITDFRRASDALRESEARLRLVTSQLPAVVWMVDRELRVTLSEGAGLAALGLKPGQRVGMSLAEFLGGGEQAGPSLAAHRQALELGSARSFDQVWNGRHFLAHVEPVRDSGQGIVGVAGVAQDVTDMRNMEERARSTQRLESLGIMAGGIAHDFNNLLVGILGNADLALQEMPADAPAAEFVQDVKKAGLRASELTNLMLAFAGRSRFSVGPVSLNALTEEAVHLVRAAVSKRIDFLRNLDPHLHVVEADGVQLRQVVLNLLVNGAEAIGEGAGQISLQSGTAQVDAGLCERMVAGPSLPHGTYAFIRVRDSGRGMDEKTRVHIFEPFFSTKFRGRGLGLASALGIVRSHRGGILVESAPGEGSTFTLYLPLPAVPLTLPPTEPAAAALRGAGTILVADDEETVRSVARRMLERAGFTVVTANDGREAIAFCRAHAGPLAAVMLDLTMPHMGGEEALPEIRRACPAVPVVLMSGYAESEAVRRFATLGAQAFLQKPFDHAALAARIRAALDGPPRG